MTSQPQTTLHTLDINIKGMTCTACSMRLEKVLKKLPIHDARVNFATETATVDYETDTVTIPILIQAIENAGFHGVLAESKMDINHRSPQNMLLHAWQTQQEWWQFFGALIVALPLMWPMVGMLLASFSASAVPHINEAWFPTLSGAWQFVLASIVQFVFGKRFYRPGWQAAKSGMASMDTLVVLGTMTAFVLSTFVWLLDINGASLYYEASAGVIVFVLLGKALEARAKKSSHTALAALMRLKPQIAYRLSADETYESAISAEHLMMGDKVRIRAGESIPCDGEILRGQSQIDESMITGESMPVFKKEGDAVFAATLNGDGALIVTVTKTADNALLSHIIHLVQQAQGSRAPIQQLTDKVAAIFVPTVMVVALITLVGWLSYAAFAADSGGLTMSHIVTALIHAATVLVVACPCAVGLATPTAIVVATGLAAQQGILVRDMAALEKLKKITRVVFDKTGTLTQGHPTLVNIHIWPDKNNAHLTAETLIQWAASLEQGSHHPLAKALLDEAKHREVTFLPTTHLINHAGQGIEGVIEGQTYFIGSWRYLEDMHKSGLGRLIESPPLPATAASSQVLTHTYTQLWLATFKNNPANPIKDIIILGEMNFYDNLRQTSAAAVARLINRGLKVVILSGDKQATVQHLVQSLSKEMPIHKAQSAIEAYGDCQPQQKLHHIKSWQASGDIVAMAGDGINDAPALSLADVGFAMGAGSETALKSADIALLKNDVMQVVAAFELADATSHTIRRNLFFAFIFNTLGIPAAAFGFINPMMAGLMMAMSSVTVVSSSLWLKRWRPS